MKMKDVIRLTGLTDRAVRLYIENGLIVPDISENYAGRKNIEFSEKDVELLQNVALLRKAGFTIAEIKTILTDSANARCVVEAFIQNSETEIENKTEIIARLKGISADEEITVLTVCEALSSSVSAVKVPDEDMMHSAKDETERKLAVVFSSVLIALPVLVYAGVNVINKLQFRFSELTAKDFLWNFIFCFGWFLIFVMALVSLLLCVKKYSFSKGRKRRKTASEILILCCVALVIPSALSSVFAVGFVPTVYSQTNDADNYLLLDRHVENVYGDEIKQLFPEEIPESAGKTGDGWTDAYPYTTRYYYMYQAAIDDSFDLFAEWTLTEDEFAEAVDGAPSNYVHSEYKGGWNCFYYKDTEQVLEDGLEGSYYWFLIFAYNEQTSTVRYIASYAIDSVSGPYYLTVEW